MAQQPNLKPLTSEDSLALSHSLSGLWEGVCTTVTKDAPPVITQWKEVELYFNIEANRLGTVNGKGLFNTHSGASHALVWLGTQRGGTPDSESYFLLEGMVIYPLAQVVKVNMTKFTNRQNFVLKIDDSMLRIEVRFPICFDCALLCPVRASICKAPCD